MATVSGYADIPGGGSVYPDFETFQRYSAACSRAASDLAQLSGSFDPILQVITDVKQSLVSAISTTGDIKTNFSEGAYNDGKCTYCDDLEKCVTDLNSISDDLDTIAQQVAAYLTDGNSLGNFTVERRSTWANAAQYVIDNYNEVMKQYDNY